MAPVTASTSITVSDAGPTISNISASAASGSPAAGAGGGAALVCSKNDGPHTANLSATAQAGPCGGNLTYKWTVSEGSLTNDSSPNATFDASSLTFEDSAQDQTKTVTATLTVTDEQGKTATQTTNITVNCKPTFVRLDDVIFAKNNARVNNCGKRVLIDDAANRLSSGDYDLVLVGHRDTDEAENAPGARRRKGHRAEPGRLLDEQRALKRQPSSVAAPELAARSTSPASRWIGLAPTRLRKPAWPVRNFQHQRAQGFRDQRSR